MKLTIIDAFDIPDLTPHQIIKRKEYIEKMKRGYLSKDLTIWFCGLISCDGSARFHKRNNKTNLFSCSLFNTNEVEWVYKGKEILDEKNIDSSINKAGVKYGKQCYELRLSNYEICRFYKSIKHYKLEKFIMERKLNKIEEYLKIMRVNI